MIDREWPNFLDSANEHNIQPLSPGEEQPSPWYSEPVSTSSQTPLFGSDWTATNVQTIATTNEPTSLASSSTTNVLATTTAVISSISSSTGTSPQPGDSSSGSSDTKTIAIAVPVSVVGAALLIGALFLLLRRRRRKTQQENPSDLQVDMAQPTRTNLLPQNDTPWNGHARSHEILFDGPYPSQTASNDHIPIRPAQPFNHQINMTPRSPPPTLSVPTSPAGVTEHRQPEVGLGLPETSPVTAGWRAGSVDRPRSPFDHPLDDAMSEVSGLSDRRGATHSRDLDDISSVSSIGDDEPATRR
ncbi:hypothetical protein KXX13_007520 [Aspergillus fumigatus]|nr:hypothetical protein KXX13_007520 [Aspergillus fumigatus]KAH1574554.1 hypothetical protein KXX17_008661 [Aspergillus fumigatus]KAH2900716.1 hypothetical protein KXV75_000704 [Aspergillus fumigatus]KAH3307250.1 hypothetical protein KXV87_008112 [Aspergillus fumigatus]KAH3447340.1 hypothetical protein KXW39_004093 [Aspergillus fumigatus]